MFTCSKCNKVGSGHFCLACGNQIAPAKQEPLVIPDAEAAMIAGLQASNLKLSADLAVANVLGLPEGVAVVEPTEEAVSSNGKKSKKSK